MRVLLLSHGAGPYGAERVLLALARGLAERGHEVTLSFPHDGPAVEAARELRHVVLRVDERRRLPRTGAEVAMWLLSAPAQTAAVRRLVKEVAPDAAWVNSMYNPWAALGARLAGVPVIWHLHERSPPGPAGVAMGALVAMTAVRAVYVSDYAAGTFVPAARPHRRRVIPNPLIEAVTLVDATPERPFTVGYLGQLEPSKRAPDVIAAVAPLPEVRAVFIGDGKARKHLEAAVEAAGLSGRVDLLGYREDGIAQLARVDCLAVPSLGEGFGLVVLEAMAAGVPVIAAESGALPEVAGDAALYHRPKDPGDLRRQIDRLRSEPELRETLRRRGLARASEFRRDRWLDAVESVLDEVATKPTGNG